MLPPNVEKCPFDRKYNSAHAVCKSCPIKCRAKKNKPMSKPSKYGNKKVEYDGIKFDSKRECQRYQQLKLMLKAGEISGLELQKKFELTPKNNRFRAMHYVADFVYLDKNKNLIVEDSKGFRTKEYKLKQKLMFHVHGIEIIEV